MADDLIHAILNDGIINYSYENKFESKNKRPCPLLNLTIADRKSTRKFQFVWYSKYKWITGSQVRNKPYCFYCLLLRGDKTWSHEVMSNMKNFKRKAIKHAISERHLIYQEQFQLLEEQILKEHFLSNSLFKGTSIDVQNDLIACITDVVNTKIRNDLKSAKFVSIQADVTTHVSYKSQMSIILRYVVDKNIEERFIGFFDVSKDKSAVGLSNILLAEITNWNINDKIICQTYDGVAVMAGKQNGVQAIIKKSIQKPYLFTAMPIN
ncbi:Domain of unknown function DUF4371 [Cinara cedri]|uniref:DUF4371 domain-containing protein n=1 Tax=Cinara cedri TaxID=506608 RepID=A0A5E4NK45_9HEMI|nr:Domain of unknown function DUF4371 [Cinara cedri]